MAVNGPYFVDSAKQFPYGLTLVGEIAKRLEYDPGKKPEERQQERDRDTGLPLWRGMLLDLDPEAREKTFEVTFAADVQPVAPALVAGSPIQLVRLENLQIAVYPKVTGRNRGTGQDIVKSAYMVTATGISAVKAGGADGSKAA